MEICVEFVVFFVISFSLTILKAEKYHFSHWVRVGQDSAFNIYIFETILESGIVTCIETCKANTKCHFVNFQVRTNACFHIDKQINGNATIEKKAGYVYGDKSEWNMEEYKSCGNCDGVALCSTCKSSGCSYPNDKEKASLLGNMFSTGSNISYKCNEGYDIYTRDTSAVSTCQESGQWSLIDFLCVPEGSLEFNGSFYNLVTDTKNWYDAKEEYNSCGNCDDVALCSTCKSSGCSYPNDKEKASLLGNMFSTGSNISYKCNEGYDIYTRETSAVSTCQESGQWSLIDFLCLPEGSLEFNGSFYNLVTDTKNWYDAKENCENLGGNLTDIRSGEEQNFITGLIDGAYVKVWTSGANIVDDNIFSWLDGSLLSSGYTHWGPGQPWHPEEGIRCVSVLKVWSYGWNDESCDNNMRSVCKFN